MAAPAPRQLTPDELAALSRTDLITLIGPSLMNPHDRTDAELRAVVALLVVFVKERS